MRTLEDAAPGRTALGGDVIRSGGEQMLAVLHQPSGAWRPTSVLMPGGFGWEAMTAHRAMYVWAEALAEAGFPVGRYDLPREGDSAGGPRAPGRISAWVDSVAAAAAWLRRSTECERLAVFGVGLGGFVAWAALADGLEVDELLLWGVPGSGRELLRELRAQSRIVASRFPGDRELQADGVEAGDHQLTGYLLRATEAEALNALRPAAGPSLPARVLLLGRDGRSVPDEQREQFAGTEAEEAVGEDFGLLGAPPQDAVIPRDTIRRSVRWLEAGTAGTAGAAGEAGAGRPGHTRPGRDPEIRLEDGTVEAPVTLEIAGERLFGIVGRPGHEPAVATVVFVGAGALRRVGPNRAWVELARRWAAMGIASLRFDQPGVGDSTGDGERYLPNSALYAESTGERVRHVLGELDALGLPTRTVLVGLCSGAYWALHTALADPSVVGAFMINLPIVRWDEELVAERDTGRTLNSLRGRSWRRLIRGDVTVAEIRRRIGTVTPTRLLGRRQYRLEAGQQKELEAAFDALAARGTELRLVLAEEEPLLAQLRRHGLVGSGPERWPNLVIHTLASRDHSFRALALQQEVHRTLDEGVQRILRRLSPP